jgi:GNAT superfamily N-acetyltransferase
VAGVAVRPVGQLGDENLQDLVELFRTEWETRHRDAAEVRAILERPGLVVALAEEDTGRLAAFARLLTDGITTAVIVDFLVSPRHRGRGIGRTLMEAVLSHPDLRDVERLEVACSPEMEPFYEGFGFTADLGGWRYLRRPPSPD